MKIRYFLPATLAAVMALVPSAVSAQGITSSDSNIVAALIAANQQEVAQAEIAIKQAESDRVKEFARRLQTDHTKAIEELQSYLQKSDSGMSSGVASDSAKVEPLVAVAPPDSAAPPPAPPDSAAPPPAPPADFQGKTGKDFDRAWIDAMKGAHQSALDDLRNNVIPRIQDTTLKNLVQGLLPTIGAHLREIEAIEAELK